MYYTLLTNSNDDSYHLDFSDLCKANHNIIDMIIIYTPVELSLVGLGHSCQVFYLIVHGDQIWITAALLWTLSIMRA